MSQDLDGLLGNHTDTSPPYQVLDALLKAAPGSSGVTVWSTIAEAADALGIDPSNADRAKEITRSGEAQSALWMLQGLDEGDDVFSIISGLSSAVRIYLADHADPSVDLTRQKQAEDAVKKALGIAWATDRLFGGTPQQKVDALMSLEAGRALVAFYAVTEIALPFLTDTSESGPGIVDQLLESHRDAELEKLGGTVGADRTGGATTLVPLLTPHLKDAVEANEKRLDKLVEQMQKRLPALLSVTGQLGEAAAHGVDALPMYHLLSARLLAEAALRQAADPESYPLPLDEDKERIVAEARARAEEQARASLEAEKARLAEETERERAEAERERETAERHAEQERATAERHAEQERAEAERQRAEAERQLAAPGSTVRPRK